ncbi:MAG: DUF460 domain-containing protein [Candidatus Micrarchaeota archaeon]|nr:DUF460 domain-containing protein [Candidatus Micrarchaeota archaeon]
MYLIAGIDPGKTCGIVCLDLKGKLLYRAHRTFGGHDWLIEVLNGVGTPVIVASDKPNASELVRRVNSAFRSRLFSPEREFKVGEKRIAAMGLGINNPHERDAYVAAISAYHAYENKFKQVEHIAMENRYKDVDELKARVVERHSIREAIDGRKANRK